MAYDARRAASVAAGQGATSFEQILRLLVDEANYPRLYHLAWLNDPNNAPDERAEFLAGIDCNLDGIQTRISRNKADKTRRSR